jgi:hypothetical protein
VVVKALDGAGRAAMIGALALLGHAVDVSSAEDAVREPVLGGGVPVGAVVPGAGVQSG